MRWPITYLSIILPILYLQFYSDIEVQGELNEDIKEKSSGKLLFLFDALDFSANTFPLKDREYKKE